MASDVRNYSPPARQPWVLWDGVICLVGRHALKRVPVFEQRFHCKMNVKPSASHVKCWLWFPLTYNSLKIRCTLSAEPSFSGDICSSVRLSKESVQAPDGTLQRNVMRQDICPFSTWWLICGNGSTAPDSYLHLTLGGFDKIGPPYLRMLRKIFGLAGVNYLVHLGYYVMRHFVIRTGHFWGLGISLRQSLFDTWLLKYKF